MNDGWNEWSKFVLKELERLNKGMMALQNDVGHLRTDIATLKAKAGMWGAIGAAIPIILMVAIQLLTGKLTP